MSRVTSVPGQVVHRGAVLNGDQIVNLMAEAMGWNPEDGDEIRGTVLGAKMGYSDVNGRDYPIVFVLLPEDAMIANKESGELTDIVAVHGFQASLQGEFYSQRPERGDSIYIKKIGERGSAKQKGWNAPIIFSVNVTKPNGEPASIWDRPGNRREAQQPPQPQQQRFADEPPF